MGIYGSYLLKEILLTPSDICRDTYNLILFLNSPKWVLHDTFCFRVLGSPAYWCDYRVRYPIGMYSSLAFDSSPSEVLNQLLKSTNFYSKYCPTAKSLQTMEYLENLFYRNRHLGWHFGS